MRVVGLLLSGAAIAGTLACGGGEETPEVTSTTIGTDSAACSTEDAKLIKQELDPIIERFDDASSRGQSTSRIALSPVIGEMQEIRRDLGALELPPCAEKALKLSIRYMDRTIDGYLAFLGDEPDTTVESNFDLARNAQNEAVKEIAAILVKAETAD
jgi:hypothetical protein